MGRSVILGNGSLTVGLDEFGLVHDFYYPYVGLDNLTTARSSQHKIGVYVDGIFSWTDTDEWDTTVDFDADALISHINMTNKTLQIELILQDFVDLEFNALCRKIEIKNNANTQRTVRLFMHQVFEISRAGRGDTALYVPDGPYVLDYKGRCSLLIYSRTAEGTPFDKYSVGNYGIEGKEGTWRDAEDGKLEGNPVEHGGVDSVISNETTISPNGSGVIEYWVIAADSQYNAERIHEKLASSGVQNRLDATRAGWHTWLGTAEATINSMPHSDQTAIRKSLLVIKAHTDRRGGVIASCDSSIYNYGRDYYSYVWPRDGAYAMWPLIRLGYTEEPKRFFEFCRDIMNPEGYMMHKYQPDRAIGSTWHPLVHGKHSELAIQEDETAIVLFMLAEFYEETEDTDFVESLYVTMIQPMANFMASYIDEQTGLPHASYDLWEEKFLTHSYTALLVHRALVEAADFAELFNYPDDAVRWKSAAETIAKNFGVFIDPERKLIRKGFLLNENGSLTFDNTLDVSSAYGAFMFAARPFGAEHVHKSFSGIEKLLMSETPAGGSPRYENDTYFQSEPAHMGNPWFVTSLWVAQYYTQTKRNDDARRIIDWALAHAYSSGVLSEQVNPSNGSPLSVMPLVWSHAELVNTLLDIHS